MIRRLLTLFLFVFVSTSLACDNKPVGSAAVSFVTEVGPLEVGITLDNNGEVSFVSGISKRARFSLGPVNFRVGVESAQALTQERTHYLFIVWRDISGDLQRDEYEVGTSFNVTFNHSEWVREIQGINGNVIVVVERDFTEHSSQPDSFSEPDGPISNEASQRIGLISNDCLSMEGLPLPRGTRVFAVTLDPPHQVLRSEVLGQRTSGCESGLSASYRAYSISTDGWGMTYVDTAVGLVGFSAPPKLSDGSLSVRFSDDPGLVTFRNCSSSEGFHITAWRNGKRIWHVYTWVPYDTPNECTPEEVA
jgi:hypothetical protein